ELTKEELVFRMHGRLAGLAIRALTVVSLHATAWGQSVSARSSLVLPTSLLIGAFCAIGLMVLLWWLRERRIHAQHENLRIFHGLSEDIIAAPTPSAIAEKLATVLPTVSQATSVNLYLFQRRTKSLERVPTTAEPEPMAAPIDSPPDGMANAAVV